MDRRGFIKGLLAAPAAGALIIRPEDTSQVELFSPKIAEPVLIHRPSQFQGVRDGDAVFDSEGRILGFVTSYEIHARMAGLTTMRLDLIVTGPAQIRLWRGEPSW